MSDDRDRILYLLREQEAAVTRGDAAGVVAVIAGDAVFYDLPPPLEHRGNAPAHIDGLQGWFASWEGGVTTELTDPAVLIDGDLAVVHGLSRMRGKKKGEAVIDSWNRRTVILRRDGRDWRIVHEHSSHPLEMNGSGRAATNLKPTP